MEEWKTYKLGDIASVQTGPFGSQLHNEDYVNDGTPIVTVEHLGSREFTTQNLPMVSNEDKDRLIKYSLEEGDIVFSRVGSVDRCSYVGKEQKGWLFSGRCLRVRAEETINPQFLYYYFQKDYFPIYEQFDAKKTIFDGWNCRLFCRKCTDATDQPVPSEICHRQHSIRGLWIF